MCWSIDRLGRSVLHVANALAELDAAGVRLYCDQQGIDSSTPMGRAMIQMASVFGEQERSMLRSRVLAGLDRVRQQGKKLGRPKVSPKVENAIRKHLEAGNGILKVAAMVGVGSGTVQREGDGRSVDGSRMSQTVQRSVDAAFWGWLGCGHSSSVAP
jgi:DNA invertase Pin-like site-specific DNA recombinase